MTEKKKKMGRPPREVDARVISLRLEPEDLRAVEEYAKREGLSRNKSIGKLLRIAISQEDSLRALVTSPQFKHVLVAAALEEGGLMNLLRGAADGKIPTAFQENLIAQLRGGS